MCGIVGYVGKREAFPVLMEGLSALEYRGYDSAGVALIDKGKIAVLKNKGKVAQLREFAEKKVKKGATIGIAHTRWATHGVPSQANAHPHTDMNNRIALVHNGIIENYGTLKEKLKKEGVVFRSETDTEVLAQLVGKYYKGDLVGAVSKALAEVDGTFGIAVIAADNPNVLVGARRGSPLVVGVGDGEYFLASDASAIVRYTKRVIYLKDSSLVVLDRTDHTIMDLDQKVMVHEIQHVDYSAEALAKGGFAHFMLKEIFEQPDTIRNAMRGRLLVDDGSARLDGLNLVLQQLRQINRIIFVACGTSWHAALVGEHMIEEIAGVSRRGGIRLGIPLPQSHHRPAHPRVCHKSIRRDRRHARGPARGREQGRHRARHLQRGGVVHRARDPRRRVPPRRAGNRRGLDQGLHLAAHRAGPAHAASRPHAQDFTRRRC